MVKKKEGIVFYGYRFNFTPEEFLIAIIESELIEKKCEYDTKTIAMLSGIGAEKVDELLDSYHKKMRIEKPDLHKTKEENDSAERAENSKDIYCFYRMLFQEKFNIKAIFSVKDASICKRLHKELGGEVFKDLIKFTVENWDSIQQELKVNGPPTLGLFSSCISRIQFMQRNGIKKAQVQNVRVERFDEKASHKESGW